MATHCTSTVAALLLSIVCASSARAQASPADDNAYLDRLLGAWEMSGNMGQLALHYHAKGERVLEGGFVRLHMIDAAPTPQYEADVFIGYDPKAHDYIAHWLDRFGAAGARVVGTGKRTGNRLVVLFPYSSGAFRDTFTFLPDGGAWSLLLESKNPNHTWSTFATYTFARPK